MTPIQKAGVPLAVLVVVMLCWEFAVRATATSGLVPSPIDIARAGWLLTSEGVVPRALFGSLVRVLQGFTFAAAIGIPVGLAIGMIPTLDRTIGPVLDGLRSIAPIAWIPMAILWLGVRGDAALFVVAYAAVFPFIVNTSEAARRIDNRLLAAAASLGAGRMLMTSAVVLPSALPFIFTGARISMAFAWGSIIAAELAIGIKVSGQTRSAMGLGQLMVETLYVRRDVNALVFYMVVIGVVSFLIDAGMQRMQSRLLPWVPK